MIVGSVKITMLFAWYDLWIGAFYDKGGRQLFILPIPCCGLRLQFGMRPMLALSALADELERDTGREGIGE